MSDNKYIPIEVMQKMDMGSSSSSATIAHTCKISMLWNWYTIDSCFLARSWHVTSRGMFAGTCIGVFFFILAYCWFHRFIVEYDRSIVDYKVAKYNQENTSCCCNPRSGDEDSTGKDSGNDEKTIKTETNVPRPGANFWGPLSSTLSHKWYFGWLNKKHGDEVAIYPSPAEHIGRSGLYLMEWTVSYLIMLLWMYYNGYLIITMILGYFFGQLIFNYSPLTVINKSNFLPDPIPQAHC